MILEGFREFNRLVAAEGAVLLKNDGDVLPIQNEKTAVFGRTQIDYYKSGAGSGGAVNTLYAVNILEGMRNCGNIIVDEEIADLYAELLKDAPNPVENLWSDNFTDCEIEIEEETIKNAAKRNQKAVIVIGRLAGESYDMKNTAGGYLLTPNEKRLISNVGKYFKQYAVLLNCGGIIDMKWVEEEKVPCVMYIWHGGEEGGDAAADVLSGTVSPSGRLTDTIAKEYSAYPSSANFDEENEIFCCEDIYTGYRWFETFDKDNVLYPFGYGLSYTSFEIVCMVADKRDNIIELTFKVKNVGTRDGREIVQVYVECGYDKLSRPARELVAFAKTKTIKPYGEEFIKISIDITKTAAYDDIGATGHKSAWVLEKGTYNIYAGANVRETKKVFSYGIPETVVIEQLSERMCPRAELERATNEGGKTKYEKLCLKNIGGINKQLSEIKDGYKKSFAEAVKEGKIKEFAGAMTNDELITLSRGEGMLSPKVTPGVASCFGGVSEGLLDKGIPLAATADGPSGIRMDNGETASSMPCGTLLASSWDTDMVEKLYELCGKELVLNKIDMLLGPGMNLHRNPLCGRNFEYFSEDPLLTGMMGAACIKGLHGGGSAGVIKHFACNNREYRRSDVNFVVSERALREIYLRGFEIAVRTAPVLGIMTSYNLINGYHGASCYDLTSAILRDEWGYNGIVMTDWWAKMNYSPDEAGDKTKNGAMIKAQNDLYMVVENFKASVWEDDSCEALESGRITRAELQRNAVNILNVLSSLMCFEEKYGFRNSVESEKTQWFTSHKNMRDYTTVKCHIPENTEYKKPYVFVGNLRSTNENTKLYNAKGKPGDEMKFNLYMQKAASGILNLTVSADASELAQLAIFARVGGKEYPIPFRVTDKREILVNTKIDLPFGYSELIIAFAMSNTADVILSEIGVDVI